MEIQTCFTTSSKKDPPARPLEGYFRFRQEMMNSLSEEERSCENVVRLWNALSQEEKISRAKQIEIEID